MSLPKKENELRLQRIFDAPVQAVWDAWTDSDQVKHWWGPRGFTLTTHSKELRPGGHWKYTMHGPDGVDWPNNTLYYEVEPLKKLVYDHGGNDDQPPLFRVTVLFQEIDNKTHMDMTMVFDTPETTRNIKSFIKKAGGEGTWDRLAEYVSGTHSGKTQFVMARCFDAPVALLFDLWTDPVNIAKWTAPAAESFHTIQADIQKGDEHFDSTTDGGTSPWYGRVRYLEILRPSRIVFTQHFCNEDGSQSLHPDWPEPHLITLHFVEESPTTTRVRLTCEPSGNPSEVEMEAFAQSRNGMAQAWSGAFDRLETTLASPSTVPAN